MVPLSCVIITTVIFHLVTNLAALIRLQCYQVNALPSAAFLVAVIVSVH